MRVSFWQILSASSYVPSVKLGSSFLPSSEPPLAAVDLAVRLEGPASVPDETTDPRGVFERPMHIAPVSSSNSRTQRSGPPRAVGRGRSGRWKLRKENRNWGIGIRSTPKMKRNTLDRMWRGNVMSVSTGRAVRYHVDCAGCVDSSRAVY